MKVRKRKPKFSKTIKSGKEGPINRHIFVEAGRIRDESERRLSFFIRLIIVVVILIVAVLSIVFLVTYLIPFLQNSFLQKKDTVSNLSTASAMTSSTVTYDKSGLPVYDDSLNLFVINTFSPADSSFVPETEGVEGIQVDKRIAPALRLMIEEAEEDGYLLEFTKGYVPYSEQETLNGSMVNKLMEEENQTSIMARENAKLIVPQAGESDFQTGLCVQVKGSPETFKSSGTYAWLNSNMANYGFVFRYPDGAKAETGLSADYTVIRYVGVQHAAKMRQYAKSLEEYIDYLNNQNQ